MKTYTFRKQTQGDFKARLKRVDPGLARFGFTASGKDKTPERPVFWSLTGFGWVYMVISVARNKGYIQESLSQGSLAAEHHDLIIAGLGIMLAVSGVMLLLHIVRFLAKRGPKRTNSRGLLMGALAAGALIYTPPSVFEAGLGLLDDNSRTLLLAAHSTVTDTVPNVDWTNIALASSAGK